MSFDKIRRKFQKGNREAKKPTPSPQKAVPPFAEALMVKQKAPEEPGLAEVTGSPAAEEPGEKDIILAGTVARVRLGQVVTGESFCDEHGEGHGYVWGLGRRSKPKLAIVRDDEPQQDETPDEGFQAQLIEARAYLEKHSLPEEEGPYADNGGRIEDFSNRLLEGVEEGNLQGMIDRLMSLNPAVDGRFNSAYNGDFMAPDVLPTAGEILSQRRFVEERVTGAQQFTFAHPIEIYLLATATLRHKGYPAYPAQAIVPHSEGGEMRASLMSILDLSKEIPLTTFDVYHTHPPAGAIDLLSDTAVMAVLYAELAEMRIKHLSVKMVKAWNETGKVFPDDEVDNGLKAIASALFESVKRWDGNQYIEKATHYFLTDFTTAFLSVDSNMALPEVGAMPVMTHEGMRLPSMAEASAKRYGQFMLGHLSRMITKAKVEEE